MENDRKNLTEFWTRFFADLLVGTATRVFLFAFLGICLGVACACALKWQSLDPRVWNAWIEWPILLLTFSWYGALGTFHGMAAGLIHSAGRKFSEAIEGLHDLFDILSREVLQTVFKSGETIPREVAEQKFKNLGNEFLRNLRRKKGLAAVFASVLLGLILRGFKFLFLDEVVEKLSRTDKREIAQSDIENALRRVGVGKLTEPLHDAILLTKLLNCATLIFLFALPFLLFRLP